MVMKSTNPATGALLERFEEMTEEETLAAVEQAATAQLAWRDVPLAERSAHLNVVARVLRKNAERLARTATLEMGKPIREALIEVEKCALVCEHYAEQAKTYLAPEPAQNDASKSYVAFRPLGCVLLVMPWNYPFWQVFRQAAPGLMAGNAVLLKHASNVSRCALHIEEILCTAGLPEGVFRTLLIGSRQVAPVLEHQAVRAVSLTGSDTAGRAVAAKAGSLLKKCVIELGGSDPFIVLEDADLDRAAEVATISRCLNSGQACIAAKRFIVVEAVHDAFLSRFTARMAALKMGDPLDPATQIGPLAHHDFKLELHGQITDSLAAGATIALGADPEPGDGAFYPPTILTGVRPGMRAYHEELFGPVASVIAVRDEEEAVRVANDTRFGLGGSVWTRDAARGERVATRIEAGCVFVNGLVKSDPRLPFGGIKDSGFGRELSHYGMRELTNIQSVWIA